MFFRFGGIRELDAVVYRIAYLPKFRIGFRGFKDKRIVVVPFSVLLEIAVFLQGITLAVELTPGILPAKEFTTFVCLFFINSLELISETE